METLKAEYSVAAVNGQFLNTQDDLPGKSIFARVGIVTEVLQGLLRVGSSGSIGSLLDDVVNVRTDYDRIGGDLTFDHPHLWIAAEYIFDRSDISDMTMDRSGWYALVGPRWSWQAGLTTVMFRYEIYDPDQDMSGDLRRRLTYGLVHDLNPGIRLMTNYEQDASEGDGTDRFIFQTLFSF
jgi:hypothetical protein